MRFYAFEAIWHSDGTCRVIEIRTRQISRPLSRMMADEYAASCNKELRAQKFESLRNLMSSLAMA